MSYKVPFVDYPAHYRSLEGEINAAIKGVLSGGDLILRDQLRQFEENVASFTGTKYAVGLNSGTDALYLSLLAAGIGPHVHRVSDLETVVLRAVDHGGLVGSVVRPVQAVSGFGVRERGGGRDGQPFGSGVLGDRRAAKSDRQSGIPCRGR